jgi:hypothetical protein
MGRSLRQAAAFISYALPSLPGFDSPKTYAGWPVWRDSTTEEVKFTPLSKKKATILFHKARRFVVAGVGNGCNRRIEATADVMQEVESKDVQHREAIAA